MKSKVKINHYLTVTCIIIGCLIIAVFIGFFTNNRTNQELLSAQRYDYEELSEQGLIPEELSAQEPKSEYPSEQNPMPEGDFVIMTSSDFPYRQNLSAMITGAEYIVVGSFQEFVTSFNNARERFEIELPSAEHHHEGRVYQFRVDAVLKGDLVEDIIHINLPHFRLRQGSINNAVISSTGSLLQEATEFDPYSVEILNPRFMEPVIGETIILFLNYNPLARDYVDLAAYPQINGLFRPSGEPYVIILNADGYVQLKSNLLNPEKAQPQIFESEGGRTIIVHSDISDIVLEDTISGLSLGELLSAFVTNEQQLANEILGIISIRDQSFAVSSEATD